MKRKLKSVLAGVLIGVIVASVSAFAITGEIQKVLQYNNIKITLNGEEILPKDAAGNYIEPFIIEGTTYLPVRGVASALGLNVEWDAETNTVVLSEGQSKEEQGKNEQAVKAAEEIANTYATVFPKMLREILTESYGFSEDRQYMQKKMQA